MGGHILYPPRVKLFSQSELRTHYFQLIGKLLYIFVLLSGDGGPHWRCDLLQTGVSQHPLNPSASSQVSIQQGWEFAHWFVLRIARFLWEKEQKCDSLAIFFKQIALALFTKSNVSESLTVALFLWATWEICSGFVVVKSEGRKLLNSLFTKEQMSKEWRERFTLGHTKWEKLSKTVEFFERIAFLCERFAGIKSESLTSLFFIEQIAHGRSFVKSDMSETLTVAL